MATESYVLHVVCASVRADASREQRANAVDLARGLAAAPGARGVVVAESTAHLLVATWLDGAGLEAFAASAQHMAFIMRGVATVTSGMWSAAVETDTPPSITGGAPEALFVFGLRAVADGAQLYEWQVQALLEEVRGLPGDVAAGPTFEERDRFRAAGAVVIPFGGTPAFDAALAGAGPHWRTSTPALVTALAPIVATSAVAAS